MTLNELTVGCTATVTAVGGEGMLRQHFLDLGILPGAEVTVRSLAPMGDPLELLVQGYVLTLRMAEAQWIEVETNDNRAVAEGVADGNEDAVKLSDEDANRPYIESLHEHNSHPGLGEAGKYHDHATAKVPARGTVLTLALAGQVNSGKTTLFNRLTGSSEHVGNFPGVTVECREGIITAHPDARVADLPGFYSLTPYTAQEELSRRYIVEQKPACIVGVVDASNIERHLYLTMQLMELDVPMVLALNMMDEVAGNGGTIRVNEMERLLGIPVVPISAARGEGVEELVEHALHVARYQEKPLRKDFCDPSDRGGAVHRCLHSIMHLVEDHAVAASMPLRFVASQLVEGDEAVLDALHLTPNEKDMLEHIIRQMEEECGMDRQAAMADMRYAFISRLCHATVVKPRESREQSRSRRIDRVLTGRWTALPIFLAVMCLVIWLSIDVLGAPLQNALSEGIAALGRLCSHGMERVGVSPAVISLVCDALFGGVGSLLSFVPVIVLLFFFLSLIEDSGYMSRVAFVTDKLLRRLGLSGRSIVPLLIGFGCSVPAIMATRTLPSARDRLKTILLTPFMSCSAKVTIYAFFVSAFFPQHGGLVLVGLYLLSIVVGVALVLLLKCFGHGEEAAPFVMEMPNYRLPAAKSVAHLLWDKTRDFIQCAFTVIFITTIIIWFLQTFDFRFQMVENGRGSMLAVIANFVAPLFRPLGLDDWRVVTAFISGFFRKESVVSTMGVLGVADMLTPASALSMLLFCLLYTPCVAAIAAVRRELGRPWALFMVVFQCFIAWLVAWAGYMIMN